MAKRTRDSETAEQTPTGEYTVVARRYRPQQFAQLIGQESAAQALINAIRSNRVAHAYLFTGARGVGKTSAARILAKALNCEKGPTPTPCDQCDICRSIATGDDVDVVEIDGASNRNIEDIRDVRQNVTFKPARARFKIYIIDEVHMLTNFAFNALLKTLEEPPAGVKFIFATTEVNKVPVTILSRCQRFDFKLIATSRVAEQLQVIVNQEKIVADDEAIDAIARRAAGSMRDAESLLDQLMSYGEPITVALVHKLIGTAPADRVRAITQAVWSRDAGQALDQFAACIADGAHVGELIDQLVEFWRDLMLVAGAGEDVSGLSNPLSTLQPLVAATSIDVILAGLDVLASTKARLRSTGYGHLLAEMALVRLARLDQLYSVGDLWALSQGGSPSASANVPAPNIRMPALGARPNMAEPEKKNQPMKLATRRSR